MLVWSQLYFLVHFESLISVLDSTSTCSGPGLILGFTDFDGPGCFYFPWARMSTLSSSSSLLLIMSLSRKGQKVMSLLGWSHLSDKHNYPSKSFKGHLYLMLFWRTQNELVTAVVKSQPECHASTSRLFRLYDFWLFSFSRGWGNV